MLVVIVLTSSSMSFRRSVYGAKPLNRIKNNKRSDVDVDNVPYYLLSCFYLHLAS